jgi:hypothetical protein
MIWWSKCEILRKPLRPREDVSPSDLKDLEKRGLQADAVTCGALLGVRKLTANLHTWPVALDDFDATEYGFSP